MRKRKTIKVDDLEITVFEVIIEDLISVKLPESMADLQTNLSDLLPRCTDLTVDQIKKMAPSDLVQIWEAFREVNDVFFSLAKKLNIQKLAIDSIGTFFADGFAGSLKAAIPGPQDTESVSL